MNPLLAGLQHHMEVTQPLVVVDARYTVPEHDGMSVLECALRHSCGFNRAEARAKGQRFFSL